MNKHRLNTTISAKHWEILKKHTENFETQQKVLEAALECLKKNSNQNPEPSPEEQLWMRMGKEIRQNLSVIHKEVLKVLMRTADFEKLMKVTIGLNLIEYQVAFCCRKPPKECSLKEIMNGIIHTFRISNLFDSIDSTDCGSYYSLEAVHSLGTDSENASILIKLFFQDFFETYGVKTESIISENSLFMKIYKNSKQGSVT